MRTEALQAMARMAATVLILGVCPPEMLLARGVSEADETRHLPDGTIARLGKGGLGEGDRAVAFSPVDQGLAVASGIGIWLYDVETSRVLALLPTASFVTSVSFSRDGTMLASSQGNTVKLWDVAAREEIATLDEHTGTVYSVSFSLDGTILASGSLDKTVKLWDVAAREEIATLPGHTGPVSSVSFSLDGTILASGSRIGEVRLWDVAAREEIATLGGHPYGVRSVSFSPDGTILASTGLQNRTIKLWDVAAREEIATLREHTGPVHSVSFSPDGTILASGSADGTVKLWDVAARERIATLSEHTGTVYSVSFSLDGTILASSGSGDGTVKLWDVAARERIATLSGHTDPVHSVSFSPDGTMLASGLRNGTVKLWDVAARERIATLPGHTGQVYSLSFSPDGTMLASGSSGDDTVKLWDVAARERIATFEEHTSAVYSVSFSPDGTILASGSWDQTIKLWDVATRERIATLEEHTGPVHSVSFSPDGTILASGSSWDRTIKLWDVATKQSIATLPGHTDWVGSVSFSPGGTILASGSRDETIRLWDVATRERIATLPGHAYGVESVSFSRGGTMLASLGSRDNTVKLWDVATRGRIATFSGGHTDWVLSASLSPDGMILASGSWDGTVLLWDLSAWTQPRLRTLRVEISGDNQQGAPGAALASPLVVEVRGPYFHLLPGAQVTFTVTAGEGRLSGRFTVERATTDANGRAERILTLGPDPGTNTVEVRVAGFEQVTSFHAVGVETPATPGMGGTAGSSFPGDFDGDLDVDFADFLAFAHVFGLTSSDPGYRLRMDMDGSGAIDFVDFVVFAGTFGTTYTERDALVALYHATDGDNWTNRTNWLIDTELSTWHGVTVSNGRVTHLVLSDNELSGPVPAVLGGLSNLTALELGDNYLRGAIPPEWGRLSKLETLSLGRNELSGPVPSELGNLSNLALLDLSYNVPLRGPLPQSLTTLPRLSWVIIRGTGLCAPLDAAFQAWLQGLRGWKGNSCQAEATPTTDFTFPLASGNTWKYRVTVEQRLPLSSDRVEHSQWAADVRWQIFGKESVQGVDAYRMETTYRYTGGPERGEVVTGQSWYTMEGDTLWAVASQGIGMLFPETARLHKVAINATQDMPNPWNVAVLVFPLKINSEWDFGSPHLPSKKVVEAIEEISVLNQTFETFKVVRIVDTPSIQLRTEQWFASIGLIRMKEEMSYVSDQIDAAGNVIGQLRGGRVVDMELESYQPR